MLERLQEKAVQEQADRDAPLSIQYVVDRVLARHPGRESAMGYEASAREMIDVAKAHYYPQVSGVFLVAMKSTVPVAMTRRPCKAWM
ncbi:hypothetical protein ACFWQD_05805 [Alcaligenes faecalis]|uniref:hypothetical protein n=1 Tax=Alcaligenes faecalis TaxID=511 RepID=UPI003650FED1